MDARVEDRIDRTGEERPADGQAVMAILFGLSFSHLLNDTIQSLVPSVYPILKTSFRLDFGQIGLITLAFQLTASFLQPVVGILTDRRPSPFSLAMGMAFSLCGLVMLSRAGSYHVIVASAAMIGIGSSIFHPEASRIARAASGGRHGFAQSLFQVGGYWGAALGPLLAAFIVVPHGQGTRSPGSPACWRCVGIVVLSLGRHAGIAGQLSPAPRRGAPRPTGCPATLPPRRIALVDRGRHAGGPDLLQVSSTWRASATYYTFYLIEHFHLRRADRRSCCLFAVPDGSVAVGTWWWAGRSATGSAVKLVIWVLYSRRAAVHPGAAATLNLFDGPRCSTVPIGLILASAFSAILVSTRRS